MLVSNKPPAGQLSPVRARNSAIKLSIHALHADQATHHDNQLPRSRQATRASEGDLAAVLGGLPCAPVAGQVLWNAGECKLTPHFYALQYYMCIEMHVAEGWLDEAQCDIPLKV